MSYTKPAAVWIGTQSLIELPEASISEEAFGVTTNITLEGQWSECLARKPRIGQTIKGWVGLIQRLYLQRNAGATGRIDITLFQSYEDAEGGQLAPSRYEIYDNEFEKALETHIRYNGKGPFGSVTMKTEAKIEVPSTNTSPDRKKLRDILIKLFATESTAQTTVGALVAAIKSCSPDERRAILEAGVNSSVKNLLVDFFKKWDAGIEAFMAFAPCARKTTEYAKPVKPSGLGKIGTPTGFTILPTAPSGTYEWLKTGDRISWTGRNGHCERVEEWKGTVGIDHDLYQ